MCVCVCVCASSTVASCLNSVRCIWLRKRLISCLNVILLVTTYCLSFGLINIFDVAALSSSRLLIDYLYYGLVLQFILSVNCFVQVCSGLVK